MNNSSGRPRPATRFRGLSNTPPPTNARDNPNSFTSLIESIDPEEVARAFRQQRHRRQEQPQPTGQPTFGFHPQPQFSGRTRPPHDPRNSAQAIWERENAADTWRDRRGLPSLLEAISRPHVGLDLLPHPESEEGSEEDDEESEDEEEESEDESSELIELSEDDDPDSVQVDMPPIRRSDTGAGTTTSSRRRTAQQAFATAIQESEDEGLGPSETGPRQRKRRNVGNGTSIAQASGSRTRQIEPIVIDDLDDSSDNEAAKTQAAEQLKETLQKQRTEQVAAQNAPTEADSPPRLNKLQCVICMDTFTDMTATSCGHIFCHACLFSALRASENRRMATTGVAGKKSQCPVCRTNLNRTKAGDVVPLLIMKKGAATQPRRARGAAAG